jgi:hypothetical protein
LAFGLWSGSLARSLPKTEDLRAKTKEDINEGMRIERTCQQLQHLP